MSKIGENEVKHIAELAKIGLSPEEVSQMSLELGQIVDFVEQLQKVDTKGVEPTNQVTGLVDVWRADEVRQGGPGTDQLLANAPQRQGNYIKVRRVL